jgi:1D-myo-inositol 3-kinase
VPRSDTAPDLVVVGAASRDYDADDARGWRLGGTATYASLAAARMGLRVGCLLGVDGPAAVARELLVLEMGGVMVRRVRLASGPVFDNIETDGHRRQRWTSPSDRVPATALPEAWQGARGWLLGPVAGELDAEWAGVPTAGARLCVGWQGLLRHFAPDGWVERVAPGPSPLLERAGLVCASLDDVPPGCRLEDLRALAPRAAVVLTAGARGGFAAGPIAREATGGAGHGGDDVSQLSPVRGSRYRAVPAQSVDPTGAGDVFMAALMAVWLLTGDLATPRALRVAAAAGSCAVERPGLEGVPSKRQLAARLAGPERGAGARP